LVETGVIYEISSSLNSHVLLT